MSHEALTREEIGRLFDDQGIHREVLYGVRGAILSGAEDVRTLLEALGRCLDRADIKAAQQLVAAVLRDVPTLGREKQ